MPFSSGDSFLNNSSSGLPSHLWIVISEPTHSFEQVVIVNFTTYNGLRDEDQSCVLSNGEHSFIKHKTYVNYRDAQTPRIHMLKKAETTGLITRMEPVDEILLAKILEGAKSTPFLKLKIRKLLEDQYLI